MSLRSLRNWQHDLHPEHVQTLQLSEGFFNRHALDPRLQAIKSVIVRMDLHGHTTSRDLVQLKGLRRIKVASTDPWMLDLRTPAYAPEMLRAAFKASRDEADEPVKITWWWS
jgi:hypothetical protein